MEDSVSARNKLNWPSLHKLMESIYMTVIYRKGSLSRRPKEFESRQRGGGISDATLGWVVISQFLNLSEHWPP